MIGPKIQKINKDVETIVIDDETLEINAETVEINIDTETDDVDAETADHNIDTDGVDINPELSEINKDAETADTITTWIDKFKIINKKSNEDLSIVVLDTIAHISLPFVFLTTCEFDRFSFMCNRS